MMVLLVLCLLGDKPQIMHHGDDYLGVTLPQEVLADPAIKRRLLSGLTMSIELEAHLATGAEERVTRALLTVRYDVWEERIELHKIEPELGVSSFVFSSLEAMLTWLGLHGIRVAPLVDTDYPLKLRIVCRIIPYSVAEARATRDWFSQRLKVARAVERGLVAAEGNTGPEANGVFEVLMRSGIRERAVQVHRWKWRLPERSGP